MSAQPAGGQLERATGAGGRLEEDVDDRAAAQRRHLLDVALHHRLEALGRRPAAARRRRGRGRRSRSGGGVRWAGSVPRSLLFAVQKDDAVDVVDLAQVDVDALLAQRWAGSCRRSRAGSAARGGRGRPAPPAAPARPAVVEQRLDGGPDGAAGVQHVVHQHDRPAVDREVQVGGPVAIWPRLGGRPAPRRRRGRSSRRARRWPRELPVNCSIRSCRRSASGTPRVWMPTRASVVEVVVLLDDLVGDPPQRALDLLAVQELPLCGGRRHGHTGSFPASQGAD